MLSSNSLSKKHDQCGKHHLGKRDAAFPDHFTIPNVIPNALQHMETARFFLLRAGSGVFSLSDRSRLVRQMREVAKIRSVWC
jgi:hypothetical protein